MSFWKYLVGKLSSSFQTNCLQKIRWCYTSILLNKGSCWKVSNYLNKEDKNIKFTPESVENGSLSFLNITVSRENNKFVTSVYRKPAFSGVFTNFESLIPDMQKRELIETLLHRSFKLCSNYENFHREIETLKAIIKRNNHSSPNLCE